MTVPPGLMGSAAEMLIGGALLGLASLARGERLHAAPSWHALLALGYLTLFGSIVAFSAFLYLLGRVRPSLATSYAYVNPVVAMGVGVGLAGERVGTAGLLALPVILGGVLMVLLGRGDR